MSNALAVRDSRTAAAVASNLDPFATAGQDMAGSHGTYLKFNGNSGEFTYGAEAEELELGTKLAVDMNSFRRGWICWVNEEVVEEIMVRVVDGKPPEKHELTDHGPYVVTEERKDGWTEQAAVTLRDIETGKEFIFKHSSLSALRALGQLLKDFAKDYKNHPGELPIVELDTSSFIPKNKKYGKKYSPKFNIVEWVGEEELMSRFGENAADYQGDEGGDAEETTKQVEAPKEEPKPAATPGLARRRAF
jgi:hypothetical protein